MISKEEMSKNKEPELIVYGFQVKAMPGKTEELAEKEDQTERQIVGPTR